MISQPNGREAELVEFRDRKELKAWLDKQPREVSVAIAARAALRVLPVLEHANEAGDFTRTIFLAVFRATGVAWVAAKYPTQATRLRATAAAADATADAAYAAAAASWAAVSGDATRVEEGTAAADIAALAPRPAGRA
jgi:hypothetical protein